MSSLPPSVERPLPGNAACWWVLAYVALLPLPGLAEAVLAAGALFAVVRLLQLRGRRGIAPLLTVEAWGLTCLLFLAYWLPQALAAIDAQSPGKAWGKALGALRYLPFMWLVAISVATGARRRRTFGGIALIALAWSVDALLQALAGGSPLLWLLDQGKLALSGKMLCPQAEIAALGRINGIFSECNPKLGQVLAVLAPFALLLARGRRWLWCVLAMLVGAAIMLAGARAAWISYALVLLLCGWQVLGRRGVLALGAAGVMACAGMVALQPALQARMASSVQMFSGQPGAVDAALSGRGRIWAGAACMIAQHPVNGVGVRGFRQAWPDCDPDPDVAGAWGEGPALHAHQLVLEVLAETGVLGLLLWLAGAALAIRAWRYADAVARRRALPAAVAAAVVVFPLNTHLAVYSAFWGGVTLLLLALYVGALQARD
jgi:O-antigen ligase